MDTVYHYPPDLFELVVETLPLLCRGKMNVIDYFRGAGTPIELLSDLEEQVRTNPKEIGKHRITRTILHRLNSFGDNGIRARREILKRITETEDYSTGWPEDQLKAMGLVSRIRDVINVKDSFTRMSNEREAELKRHREQYVLVQEQRRRQREIVDAVKARLYGLFTETNAAKRGKALEGVLNDLFEAYSISIREAFSVKMVNGIVSEQIDGAIELDGDVFIVEMKWTKDPIDRPHIAPHLVSLYSRGNVAGMYISASGYTQPAIDDARQALKHTVCILCELDELIHLLDQSEDDMAGFLRSKVRTAKLEKQPRYRPFDVSPN